MAQIVKLADVPSIKKHLMPTEIFEDSDPPVYRERPPQNSRPRMLPVGVRVVILFAVLVSVMWLSMRFISPLLHW